MNLDQNTLEEFENITQKDIRSFFKRAVTFLQRDRVIFLQYYSGATKTIEAEYFQKFDALKRELTTVFEAFQLHSGVLTHSRWWELVSLLEELDSSFQNLQNAHRWSRSSIGKFGYDPNTRASYIMNEDQTLERISQDILMNQNPQDDWFDIAIENNLEEEEYTSEGGKELSINIQKNRESLKLNSVMDVVEGKKIYGIDIDKKITFVFDQEGFCDLKTLSHDETIVQAVETIVLLRKNDNPDKPTDGLQTSVMVGGNRALLNFPVITRQLAQTFAGDDTLKNFMVKNIAFDQDNLLISYEIRTRLDELLENTQSL